MLLFYHKNKWLNSFSLSSGIETSVLVETTRSVPAACIWEGRSWNRIVVDRKTPK